jgi:hypothetical protein
MRVQSIQNRNPNFNARLRVFGKYFVKEEYDVLAKKADKIGFENDVVELNYTNYRDGSIEFLGQKQPDYLNKISVLLQAKFFPNNEGIGTEIHKECVSDDNYRRFWNKEYKIANNYLDRLMQKYANERMGVSIIEN